MKRLLLATVCSAIILALFLSGGCAYGASVQIALPTFPVTLNGTQIENATRQYPLITYKGITYFPMTYYDCRFLDLESNYTTETGLYIKKTSVAGSYYDYRLSGNNLPTGTAQTATFSIHINEKAVDNGKEEYPLLLYRGITYFPLTWRFAVDEFGWKYSFDNTLGLVISSNSASGRIDSMTVKLPVSEFGDVTAADGYFYYQGAGEKIFQAPISDPSKAKEVYKFQHTGDPTHAGLVSDKGVAYLNYHVGGAVMGSDYRIRLNSNGTVTEVDPYVTEFGNISVRVQPQGGGMPIPDNLSIKTPNDKDFRLIGRGGSDVDSRYYSSNGMAVAGDKLFIDSRTERSNDSPHYIYQVDITTGESQKIVSKEIVSFALRGNELYYITSGMSGNGQLYWSDLSGEAPAKLVEGKIKEFALSENDIYYIAVGDKGLYRLSDGKAILPGGTAYGLYSKDGYIYCSFDGDSTIPYRKIILDKKGDIICQSDDYNRDRVLIYQDKIIYINQAYF